MDSKRGRVPFDRWCASFETLRGQRVTALFERLQRNTIHPVHILKLLWLYSCAPSQKDLQQALFASDQEIASLRRCLADTAAAVERFNERVAVQEFLEIMERSGILPNQKTLSGVILKDIPQQLKLMPTILRLYARALGLGRELFKSAIADRPLFRGRVLQLLHSSMRLGDPTTNPIKNMATLLQPALLAAGRKDAASDETNLRRQLARFKAIYAAETREAIIVAALSHDQPSLWNGLLLAWLAAKEPISGIHPL